MTTKRVVRKIRPTFSKVRRIADATGCQNRQPLFGRPAGYWRLKDGRGVRRGRYFYVVLTFESFEKRNEPFVITNAGRVLYRYRDVYPKRNLRRIAYIGRRA